MVASGLCNAFILQGVLKQIKEPLRTSLQWVGRECVGRGSGFQKLKGLRFRVLGFRGFEGLAVERLFKQVVGLRILRCGMQLTG